MKDSSTSLRVDRRWAVLLAAPLLVATACSSPGEADTASEDSEDVSVSITPEDGAAEVEPDSPITVQAEDGEITEVAVEQAAPEGGPERDEGDVALDSVTGTFNDDNTEWVSDWTLTPGTTVAVNVTAETPDGESSETTSEFTTLAAEEGQRLELASNFPSSGDTVGVGMPIIINFDLPVENKAQVEAAMEVRSEEPAEGAWNWFGDETAVFRPSEFWAPNQEVTVDLHLAGVPASEGVYGLTNYQMDFEIGREQITRTDNETHRMTIERDGEQIKDFPVSLGDGTQPEYRTTSGTHIVMERHQDYTMDSSTVNIPEGSSDSYRLEVAYAMRITNSGIFYHHSPGNASLGQDNISHGCINMSLEDSEWYFQESLIGDPAIVTGTTRELEVDNGWGYWQREWEEWVSQSAAGEADQTAEAGTPGSPFLEN